MRTILARLMLVAMLVPAASFGAQECPDPRRDLCPPNLLCGVPTTRRCSCLSCATGSCELVPKNCDDDDPCTIDSCDELTGCHHRPLCDDDDPCTTRRCIRVPVVPEVAASSPSASPRSWRAPTRPSRGRRSWPAPERRGRAGSSSAARRVRSDA